MKRLIGTVLAGVMMISLAACGAKKVENTVFSIDDLDGKKIGVQLGTTGDIFATDYEGDEAGTAIERFSKGNDAVMALKQGKIDCVIIDEQPAKAFIEENDDLKILEEPFATEEYAICMSKESGELKDKINQALSELKEDGTLEQIVNSYIGEEEGKNRYESPADIKRENGTINMGTNAAFPPYEFFEGQEIVGIDVDMMQAVSDKLGMELKVEDMKFDTIVVAVQTKKIDVGASGMTVTEERLKNVDFTDPYATSKQVIIVRK